jgi:hypothetical protein
MLTDESVIASTLVFVKALALIDQSVRVGAESQKIAR